MSTDPAVADDAFAALRERMLTAPLEDLPGDAEVIESTTPFEGHVFDVRSDRLRSGGAEFTREYLAHGGAVAILAIDAEGRVLLINQYRHPIRARDWEIPAGLLDHPGEEPLAAAQRELAEEADLRAEEWMPLVAFATTPGASSEIVHVFVARGLSPAASDFARVDEEAQIVPRWASVDEMIDGVLAGRLHNSILMIAVLAYVRTLG